MERILMGIDPGKRTGMVVLAHTNDRFMLIARTTVTDFSMALRWIERYYRKHWGTPCVIVVELPPQRKPGSEKTYPLFTRFMTVFKSWAETNPECEVIAIGPGEWKPFAKANKWKRPKGYTIHEVDALNMLRYFVVASEVQAKRTIVPPDIITKLAGNLTKELNDVRKNSTE
jgi:hypothetical protein